MLVVVLLRYALIWTIVLMIFFTYFLFTLYDTHKLILLCFFCPPPIPAHPAHGSWQLNTCWWVVFSYAFNIYLVLMIFRTSCLQFTLFNMTHCNPSFLRWRAWVNNEINGGGCCPHIFRPWCSPAKQGLFADAHRSTTQCWWWVVLVVVQRRTQQPTHPPINTHRPTDLYPPAHHARFVRWRASRNNDGDPKNNGNTTHPVTT